MKADHAFQDDLAAIDETADAVVRRVRARADAVLAATRKTSDQLEAREPRPDVLKRSRALEDHVVLQVLSNLPSNAIKFTAAHGTVIVRVERVANDILFAVSDTGESIPVDKLEAVL